jgi:hypothetical protein
MQLEALISHRLLFLHSVRGSLQVFDSLYVGCCMLEALSRGPFMRPHTMVGRRGRILLVT